MKGRPLLASLAGLVVGFLGFAPSPCVSAQQPQAISFSLPKSPAIEPTAWTDDEVARLTSALDARLSGDSDPSRWIGNADYQIEAYVERLQVGRMTSAQQATALGHLNALAAAHPDAAAMIAQKARVLQSLLIGDAAPDIAGNDLDGAAFRLSDYRGKVVLLTFWGDWCGACRGDYPYDRLLPELYQNRPFASLSVNSDAAEADARHAVAAQHLPFRTWWDGAGQKSTRGPIASAWNVTAWPTTYLIDGNGVIRFVNLRQEDLLKAAKQLVAEQAAHPTADR